MPSFRDRAAPDPESRGHVFDAALDSGFAPYASAAG